MLKRMFQLLDVYLLDLFESIFVLLMKIEIDGSYGVYL